MESISEITRLPIIAPRPRPPLALLTQPERDRRAAARIAVEVDCEERHDAGWYYRLTSDLSPFGLSTRTGFPHRVGTRLELRLHLPDASEPVAVQAEVVGRGSDGSGMRLAFRNPSAEAVRRIQRYLRPLASE